jgi:hypothetical protein
MTGLSSGQRRRAVRPPPPFTPPDAPFEYTPRPAARRGRPHVLSYIVLSRKNGALGRVETRRVYQHPAPVFQEAPRKIMLTKTPADLESDAELVICGICISPALRNG